jgi:PPOX class probable F420-dependent enzyme
VLDLAQRAFVGERRSATLATLSPDGLPRLVPICFVLSDGALWPNRTLLFSPLDEKPKRLSDVRRLARVRDIEARPLVTLLFERWSEDWTRLAWLRAEGMASLLERDQDLATHRWAVAALRAKYEQYARQRIDELPMIAIALGKAIYWSAEAASA